MRLYVNESSKADGKRVVLDDMLLTTDLPTTAGSKMLENYVSLFEADIISKLRNAGYSVCGKANIGEFAIDLLGETSWFGACVREDGTLTNASAEILADDSIDAVICLDVNGAPRRAAALANRVFIKPTYGTVSRYGTIPVACSGETVSVMAASTAKCREALSAIVGHDDKDGTSLSEAQCALLKSDAERKAVKKVALASSLTASADEETKAKINAFRASLEAQGITVTEIDDQLLGAANTAWNVLMAAELCNNVSRYEGVKFGYRSPNYTNIDELYTNSRTEAFGDLLKTTILFGSDVLSTDNYMKMYDKGLRVRRVISEAFAGIFKEYDAVLMPACSKCSYSEADVKANKYIAYEENVYTAPASITGLPAVVVGGVQLVGAPFSDNSLLDAAEIYEKEHK
ncbi:MAG: hypothetical protein E7456_04565 [Ruminococcaceae bacterium]|nr:hypothetical protein [Oscillospiraceae bacterium]